MKSFHYICLSCGSEILVEYYEDGDWTTTSDKCPNCKTLVDRKRISNIIHDILNPPTNNPTQEYYIDKENHDKSTEQK